MEIIRHKENAMSVEVTLHLPEHLVEHAKRFGEATHRDVWQVLADTLEMIWATIGTGPELEPPISTLTDEDVLALADTKMDPIQNDRLAELQTRGKADGLTEAERVELLSLLHLYQIGQLRKSEGLAEAVRRGLRTPLRP
jgi:hypothetical protein